MAALGEHSTRGKELSPLGKSSVPHPHFCASQSRATFQQRKAGPSRPSKEQSVWRGADGLPRSTQGASKLKILAQAGSFHSPLARPHCLPPLHTWLGSACWQHRPTRNRTIFVMHILLHPHKSSCQKENIFYVLWQHRCSTRWFQPSLESGPNLPVPNKTLSSSLWLRCQRQK